MRLLHSLAKAHASFDDPNLVSHAGLVPVMALAERAGLADLVAGRRVLDGKLFVSENVAQAITGRLVQGKRPESLSPVEQLSDRELEVFEMLGHGQGTRQIAESLRLSVKTVQAYCARAKEKFGVSSLGELLRAAIRWEDAVHVK